MKMRPINFHHCLGKYYFVMTLNLSVSSINKPWICMFETLIQFAQLNFNIYIKLMFKDKIKFMP